MSKALYYPPADRTSQWALNRYPGNVMNTNTVVLHTTETTGWPSYSTGYYPTLTYHYGAKTRWRQHLPLNRSARALENDPGGVETNTLNCVQVELVGTCDRGYKAKHGGLLWSEPPEEALRDLAAFLAFMSKEWGVKLTAPAKWPAYPSSYGNGQGQRMTAQAWRGFFGVCGHMHVPENAHGDPGDLPIARVLELARTPSAPKPGPAPTPQEGGSMDAKTVWDYRIDPGPTAEKIGGYPPESEYAARELLVGAEARIRRLEGLSAARYEDLLAAVQTSAARQAAAAESLGDAVADLTAMVAALLKKGTTP